MLSALVVLCPPLAVLFTAPPSQFVKNCGLTMLFFVPGVLHARRSVEQYNANRQYDALVRVLESREGSALAA